MNQRTQPSYPPEADLVIVDDPALVIHEFCRASPVIQLETPWLVQQFGANTFWDSDGFASWPHGSYCPLTTRELLGELAPCFDVEEYSLMLFIDSDHWAVMIGDSGVIVLYASERLLTAPFRAWAQQPRRRVERPNSDNDDNRSLSSIFPVWRPRDESLLSVLRNLSFGLIVQNHKNQDAGWRIETWEGDQGTPLARDEEFIRHTDLLSHSAAVFSTRVFRARLYRSFAGDELLRFDLHHGFEVTFLDALWPEERTALEAAIAYRAPQ